MSTRLGVLVIAAGVVGAVAIAMGAGESRQLTSGGMVRGFVVPAVQIISFDDTVGMLSTATGAIYRLRGDLDNPSVQNTWELRVPPVEGPTSGYLEIQQPIFNRPDATFLVDIMTGDTWILRNRASTNRSWDKVEIYR